MALKHTANINITKRSKLVIIVGNFNRSLSVTDKTDKNISNVMESLNNTFSKLDLIKICGSCIEHAEYTFLSSTHATFIKIDLILLGRSAHHDKSQRVLIIKNYVVTEELNVWKLSK